MTVATVCLDPAIVFAPRPFVLVILVRGMAESKDSAALIADIARRIYQSAQQHASSVSFPTSKALE